MRFAVESWSVDYGSPIAELDTDARVADVSTEIERAPEAWEPIAAVAGADVGEVAFIDGVRRIDAQIWLADSSPGICASMGAGVVVCDADRAIVQSTLVARGLFSSEAAGAGDIHTSLGTYKAYPVAGSSPEELLEAVDAAMFDLEFEVGHDLASDLVVFDGPLRGRRHARGIGYVKTQHVHYLPPSLQAVVVALGPGQRTPLFDIVSRGLARRSWYMRLPTRGDYTLAGVVRCEMVSVGALDADQNRADTVTALLPRFASEPHKDGRAPQNLYPIAGLEHRLRHLLGNQPLLERALRSTAARNAA